LLLLWYSRGPTSWQEEYSSSTRSLRVAVHRSTCTKSRFVWYSEANSSVVAQWLAAVEPVIGPAVAKLVGGIFVEAAATEYSTALS